MATKDETRTLHTPPMMNTKFDTSQSIKESYKPQLSVTQEDLSEVNTRSSSAGHSHVELSKEEIDREVNNIEQLPGELSKSIDLFISDLKQPKYVKPLSITQLSSLFQHFYTKFDKAAFHYLSAGVDGNINTNPNNINDNTINSANNNNNNNGNVNGAASGNNNANQPTFLVAKETLSGGLSGIFARSRSSSGSSLIRGRRSSSLLSDSSTAQQLLSAEEIQKQLRTNELNNYKIDKFMSLCETEVFRRILEVGTSVANPPKGEVVNRSNHHQKKTLKIVTLFRNSPEFIEYDRLLYEKLQTLSALDRQGKINLVEFLKLPVDQDKFGEAKTLLTNLVSHTMAPCEKMEILLKLHKSLMFSGETNSDDFLSMLIYYIIKVSPKHIFLNTQFIKLFRNKKKLVQQEMYALTNLEASLVFIEGLTYTDFISTWQTKLNIAEKEILETPVSSKIHLPGPPKNSGAVNVDFALHETNPDVVRSNSYDGFKYAFDSSWRSIFGKIRSYTPPVQPISLPRSSSTLSLDTDKKQSTSPTRATATGSPTPTAAATPASTMTATAHQSRETWKKYKDRKFNDLKISEMKEIFEIYQKLVG